MSIFIPSLGRAHETKNCTLANLSASDAQEATIVCQTHEAMDYLKLRDQFDCNLLILPEHIKTIVPTRKYIADYCLEEGIEKFLMLDDDIEFYIRENQFTDKDDWWKLTAPDNRQLNNLINDIYDDLDTYAHVGISGREGNNRVRDEFVENTRYMRFLAYRTKEYLSCSHERVEVMEDFDIALQLLRMGHKSKIYYSYAQGQKKTQAAGGCSVWRTHEVHNAGAERLAELHPGFVRVRQKQNKTDREGFGTRKEVTVYWKKAYQSSQKEDEKNGDAETK
jgi:hypothetical protein